MKNKSGFTLIELIIVIGIIAIIGGIVMQGVGGCGFGIGSMGQTRTWDATITRCYTDTSGSGGKHGSVESHYMVGTDQGVFEVDNSFWLGVWNADEIYAKFVTGRKYHITTKGNRVVGWFFQEYPYIVAATEITPAPPASPAPSIPPPVSGLEK